VVGAALVLITQTVDQEHAIESIDFNHDRAARRDDADGPVDRDNGVYTWLAIHAGQLSRGRSAAVVASLAVTTAVLSDSTT
jgi:hypothetical protein